MDKELLKEIITLVAAVLLMVSALVLNYHYRYGDPRTYYNYTVTDKTVKNNSNNSLYLVYTKDSNGDVMVFSVDDRLLIGRYDASDDYAKIEVGKTYNFETVGIRNHFLSKYPDIIEMEEMKCEED